MRQPRRPVRAFLPAMLLLLPLLHAPAAGAPAGEPGGAEKAAAPQTASVPRAASWIQIALCPNRSHTSSP